MSYTYDLGANWRHEIVLEKVLDKHPLPQPECLTGQGDNPIEYYDPDDPDDPADPVPFDAAATNKLLHKLCHRALLTHPSAIPGRLTIA